MFDCARVSAGPLASRWWIAAAGAVLQMCLGSVYAWSYFQQPLVQAYGWTHAQVAWTFSFAIGFLGLAAAVGGRVLPRFGPRKLAAAGSLLYGLGYLLAAAAIAWRSLPLLWIGFGVIGGVGLGLGYVTPVATAAKWFPDRKGFVTGMVVMGFGFGALVMSKLLAPALEAMFDRSLPKVFAGSGILLGLVGVCASAILRNPPEVSEGGPAPAGMLVESGARASLLSTRFLMMWLMFFCNIGAGIALIGFQSPLLQDLLKAVDPVPSATALGSAGATLIAASSVCNGCGRLFWGGLSDRIGPLVAFRVLLATQVFVFMILTSVRSPWVFAVLVCYVLLCYGGGFGVMPAFVSTTFGQRLMPVAYGAILTAWSCAGIIGPQIIAHLKDQQGINLPLWAFGACAVLLALGFLVSLCLKPSSGVEQTKTANQST